MTRQRACPDLAVESAAGRYAVSDSVVVEAPAAELVNFHRGSRFWMA